MGVIKGIYNGAKKFINAIKNTIKKIGNFIKFIISPIGTILGWILFAIFIGILVSAIIKTGARAIDNFFGEDWNYSTFSEDLDIIDNMVMKPLYDSGYESVIDAENFRDFKAFEYAVLMDAAEYLRNNEINTLPVGVTTNQSLLARYGQEKLDELVASGANSRSINVDDLIGSTEGDGNNNRVTAPTLIYEFKPSSLIEDDVLMEASINGQTIIDLLEDGIIGGSLEPYVCIVKDDVDFLYSFYSAEGTKRVVELSMELNAYNATLMFGKEMSKQISLSPTLGGRTSVEVFPDYDYGKVPYYTDTTKNTVYKIPLRTILGRYMPRAELLQAWAILKQDIDEPEEEKTDIVDDLLASIKGVYNEACMSGESKTTVEKEVSGENGEIKLYNYSKATSNNSTFAQFGKAGIETTDYGLGGFTNKGLSKPITIVTDFISAFTFNGAFQVTVRVKLNPPRPILKPNGEPELDDNDEPKMQEYDNVSRTVTLEQLAAAYKTETVNEGGVQKTKQIFTSGKYIKAGEKSADGGYAPPTDVSNPESGYYVQAKEEEANAVRQDVEDAIESVTGGTLVSISNYDSVVTFSPIFLINDTTVTDELEISQTRMPILLVTNATTWAREIKYTHNLTQNKFKPDDKYYIIPSCVSSMGLEKFTTTQDENSYRGKAYEDIFARMKEKDVINTLMQLEYGGIEGNNDCYEYMRDTYKLLQAAKGYSLKQAPNKRKIHEDTYTYVYIPDTVLNYDDSQTQMIYWLNMFTANEDDPLLTEELEKMKTKDNEITWQVVEYEKYPECNGKVYALSPFGSAYARAYYEEVFTTKGDSEEISGDYGGPSPAHSGADWGGRKRIEKVYNEGQSVDDASSVGQKVYKYELDRLKLIYDSADEAKEKLKAELKEQMVNNPIVAVAPGKVITVAYESRAGFYVKIAHEIEEVDNTEKILVWTDYLHMKRWPLVNEGDYVGAGTLIGYEGNTGRSFGSHLHFEVNDGVFEYAPNMVIYPSFNPFYNSGEAAAEGYDMASDYMSLYRTVKMVGEGEAASLTNQVPRKALVDDYNNLVQRQGETTRSVSMSGEYGWNNQCDTSDKYVKFLKDKEIYDIYINEVYFDLEEAERNGFFKVPDYLYEGIYSQYYVHTGMAGSLPALTVSELQFIVDNWLKFKFCNNNTDKYNFLISNVFTPNNIREIVRIQNKYKVSALFMIAVAALEQGIGLSWYDSDTKGAGRPTEQLGGPEDHNIFSIKNSAGRLFVVHGEPAYWAVYGSYIEAFEAFANLIANKPGHYFSAGQYTIAAIANSYCPRNSIREDLTEYGWTTGVTQFVNQMWLYYKGQKSSNISLVAAHWYGDNTSLMNAIKNCLHYYVSKGYNYCYKGCQSGRAGGVPPYTDQNRSTVDFSTLKSTTALIDCPHDDDAMVSYYTDCSTYVSWVIYEYAKAKGWNELRDHFAGSQHSVEGEGENFVKHARRLSSNPNDTNGDNQYFTKIWERGNGISASKNGLEGIVQEGDIFIYTEGDSHHVDFFAGWSGSSFKVYSCGKSPREQYGFDLEPINGGRYSDLSYIIRLK